MKTVFAFLLLATTVQAQEWVCANGRCTLIRQTPRVTTIRIEERGPYRVFVPRPVTVQASASCNCATTGVCVCDPTTCTCAGCQRVRVRVRSR